jgi:type II secretory pathway pseudopilin PulG
MVSKRRRRARGFSFIGLLMLIVIMGIGVAAVGQWWQVTVKREKEFDLLFIGDEFSRAITNYYDSAPAAPRQFPRSLQDLVRDPRYPSVRRHLRRIYVDPITGRPEWGLLKGPGDTIVGVYSLSHETPLKRGNFPDWYSHFNGAASYSEWHFKYDGTRFASAPPPAASNN